MPTNSRHWLASANWLIGNVEVLDPHTPPSAKQGSSSLGNLVLERHIFKHRLDNQIAALQIILICRRRNQR